MQCLKRHGCFVRKQPSDLAFPKVWVWSQAETALHGSRMAAIVSLLSETRILKTGQEATAAPGRGHRERPQRLAFFWAMYSSNLIAMP